MVCVDSEAALLAEGCWTVCCEADGVLTEGAGVADGALAGGVASCEEASGVLSVCCVLSAHCVVSVGS